MLKKLLNIHKRKISDIFYSSVVANTCFYDKFIARNKGYGPLGNTTVKQHGLAHGCVPVDNRATRNRGVGTGYGAGSKLCLDRTDITMYCSNTKHLKDILIDDAILGVVSI